MYLHETETIGSVLRAVAARFPERTAVIDSRWRFTYAELDHYVDQTAKYLISLGVGHGDHVGIWAKDDAMTMIVFYAVWRIGAVAVPLCTSFLKVELEACCDAAELKFLVTGIAHKGQHFSSHIGVLTSPVQIISIENADPVSFCNVDAPVEDKLLLDAEAQVRPSDPDTILFTSGTTGAGKPVVTTHYARVNTMYAQAETLRVTETDILCSVLPMYHCFSLTATILAAMCSGACVCFPSDRHSQTILECVERERCTVLSAVPTLFSALLQRLVVQDYDLSSLQKGLIGGSTYSEGFFKKINRMFSFTLLSSLGQTEATAGLTASSMDDSLEVRASTIGKFFPLLEGSIRDPETNEEVPVGASGEICIRGYNVMQGYYKLPDATAMVIDKEGWLHTGDLGKIDENGYITYTGRLKELIIRGGENIAPSEIENILSADKRVKQVKVIGLPDRHYSEEICACVVQDGDLTEAAVRNLVASQAAYFKVPKYVLLLDELPMTAVGKIDLVKLRQLATELLAPQLADAALPKFL